ncbi:hypothetical protein CHARACLAT_030868 [Characodon lateralis]|uniref:Uncharacterized protein n=1 Tax=Characodon lateralis TaxID=208331 RepID=A0ABU7F7E7_9TELE|nr:hypothetical protein [Characodon lateralis]
MYTSSTSSTDIVVRHTIFHGCQESIVYPEKNVPSGQESSPLPCLPIEQILSITLKDQLTKSIIYKFGGYAKRGSEKNTDKKQKQGSAGREGEKTRVSSTVSKEEIN